MEGRAREWRCEGRRERDGDLERERVWVATMSRGREVGGCDSWEGRVGNERERERRRKGDISVGER